MAHNTTTPTLPTVTGYAGAYTQGYISAYQLAKTSAVPEFTQEIYPELFKNYGNGFLFFDFLRMAGRTFTVNSDRLTAFQETYDERPCTLATAIATGAANATIYFQLDADDFNSDGNTYLRVGNTIYFPPEYFTFSGAHQYLPVQYKVTASATTGTVGGISAGTGASTVFTAMPHNKLTVVATQIPIGTQFAVGETKFARGTGPIDGVVTNRLQYDFYTNILKEGCTIEGGANAYRFVINGQERLWDRSLYDAERRLERQKDYAITLGQMIDNTNLVQTSAAGGSRAVLSTKGVLPHVSQYGMKLPITNGNVFEFDDFDAIRELLEAKGETSGDLVYAAASGLYTDVENCPFTWIDDGHSPGSDLITNMNTFGAHFRMFKKNSYNVTLAEISSLTRATGLGAIDSMKKQGIIIPNKWASVSVEQGYGHREKIQLPNIGIGYLEGREFIMQPRAGVNEFGYPNSDGYDRASMDFLTEFLVFIMDTDKMIHVYEAGATS